MSGVEIVGFVLGGFPLLISAAEHYKSGKSWDINLWPCSWLTWRRPCYVFFRVQNLGQILDCRSYGLLSALEWLYKEKADVEILVLGFEPLLKWKRFRKDFIPFIDAIDIERQLFNNMLQRFLMSVDIPDEKLQFFMTDPEYEGWQSKELVDSLRGRLGSSYDAYMSTLKTMNQLMVDLQELLCLKNGKVMGSSP